jgi:hypothetical protein
VADSNSYSGAITFTPTLNAAEIRRAPENVLEDCRLRVREIATPTDEGEIVVRTADALEPTCNGQNGCNLVEDLQLMVDHLTLVDPGRRFGGYVEVQWEPGYGYQMPSRFLVRDGRVVEVKPRLLWPGDAIRSAHGDGI